MATDLNISYLALYTKNLLTPGLEEVAQNGFVSLDRIQDIYQGRVLLCLHLRKTGFTGLVGAGRQIILLRSIWI